MNNKFSSNANIVFLLVFIMLNIFLLFKVKTLGKLIISLETRNDSLLYENSKLGLIEECFIYSIIDSIYTIDQSLFIKNGKDEIFQLKNVLDSNKSLILWIPQNACDICYTNQLHLLEKYFRNKLENIIVLTSIESTTLNLRFSTNPFFNRIFNLMNSNRIFNDNKNLIFYAVIKDGLIIKKYYPIQEFQKLTHSFLKQF